MKVNDTIPVYAEGLHVANAVVEEIHGEEVWLIIPRTRVKASVQTSLTDLKEQAPDTDRILATNNSEDGGKSEAEEAVDTDTGTDDAGTE